MTVEPGKPIQFEELPLESDPPDEDGLDVALGKTFRAYRDAYTKLLGGKYAHLKSIASPHMREPCNTTVLRCIDGIFVRYDSAGDVRPTVRVGLMQQSISEMAPPLSDQFLHFPTDVANYTPSDTGPRITLAIHDEHGVITREVATIAPMIYGSLTWPQGLEAPTPPSRPPCLISISNEFDILMDGRIEDATPSSARKVRTEATRFVARARVALPVGWRAIEVYPPLGKEFWLPEAAPQWAELDLLFTAVQRNLQDSELKARDGRADARRKYAALLADFEFLLAGAEEPLHQFLKSHPELLCPMYESCWSKVPFGDHVSDFVIREVPNDYLLVEIEAPTRALFRKDGQQRQELTHAIDQISDWIEYIAAHRELVERDLGLTGISAGPRALVVMGRSAHLTDNDRRKLVTLQDRQPKLRIMTYDDVLVSARATLERILGPMSIVGRNAELYYYTPST